MSEIKDPLEKLFWPNAIAVVGASRDPSAIGHKLVIALQSAGFKNPIYPVNPKSDRIANLTAYPRLEDIPGPTDLVLIAVPAAIVPSLIEPAAAKGAKSLVVISAGFSETGSDGARAQRELAAQVRSRGMRMVGPNCFGVLNTSRKGPMNASFSTVFAPEGNVAMASQSGAMGLAILGMCRDYGLGLSEFVSMGNKADISSNDLIEHWEKDPRSAVILLYLESFGNPSRFAKIARRVGKQKPIIALKSGRSAAGTRAASSHTAALAASDTAVDALFLQTGVLRVETVEEMFQLGLGLSSQPIPTGNRVAILTNAGGPAILCTDACEAHDLTVPEFSEELRKRLYEFLPKSASTSNPVDMIASAGSEQYRKSVEAILDNDEIDALFVIHAVIDREIPVDLLPAIGQAAQAARERHGRNKPIFLCVMKNGQSLPPLTLTHERIPIYAFPEEPARVLGSMYRYGKWKQKPEATFSLPSRCNVEAAKQIVSQFCENKQAGFWLSPDQIQTLLRSVGIAPMSGGVAQTEEEAIRLAENIYPVALKLVSPTITHKTEVGGVVLDVGDDDSVRAGFRRITEGARSRFPDADISGILVQPMVRNATELFVGMTRDPLFGPLIGFGLGGIFVEVLSDVSFRLAPLSDGDAENQIRSIRGFKLLEGYRGHKPSDLNALQDLLLRISRLAETVSEIRTLDLNPVMGLAPGKGYQIVDARIWVEPEQSPFSD